jgi:hypothetical protein
MIMVASLRLGGVAYCDDGPDIDNARKCNDPSSAPPHFLALQLSSYP